MPDNPVELDQYRCEVSRRNTQRRRQRRIQALSEQAVPPSEKSELDRLLTGAPMYIEVETLDVRQLLYVVSDSGKPERGNRRLVAVND